MTDGRTGDQAYGAGPCSGHLTDIIVLCLQNVRSLFRHAFCRRRVSHSDAAVSASWNPGDAGPHRRTTLPHPIPPKGSQQGWRVRQRPRPPVDCAHLSWNGGANDGWLPAQARTRSLANTPVVIGYYARPDIPIHYLLADILHDLRPSTSHRFLAGRCLTGSIGSAPPSNPDGDQGGPRIVEPAIQPS